MANFEQYQRKMAAENRFSLDEILRLFSFLPLLHGVANSQLRYTKLHKIVSPRTTLTVADRTHFGQKGQQ